MGKVSTAKLKKEKIPLGWAVDEFGNDTDNPDKVEAMLPMAGAKGFGLALMVDALAGSMLGLKSGQKIEPFITGKGRGLGQLLIVINPDYFGNNNFKENISQMLENLHNIKPAAGFEGVLAPGEHSQKVYDTYQKTGIPGLKKVYEFLTE